MGGIPYGTRDDEDVKRVVLGTFKTFCPPSKFAYVSLELDHRAEMSRTRLSLIVLPIINGCWARDPYCRPPFFMTVASLLSCQNLTHPCGADCPVFTPSGPANSPVVGFPDHYSHDLRILDTSTSEAHSLSKLTPSAPSSEHQTPFDVSDGYSRPSGFGSEVGYPEPDWAGVGEASTSQAEFEISESGSLRKIRSCTVECPLPQVSMNVWAEAMQNERRYRLLAKDTHGYGDSCA